MQDFDGQKVQNNKSKKNKKDKAKGKKGSKFCLLHGQGNHTTDECTKLKTQAKHLKGETGKDGNKKPAAKKKFGNKSWNKKAKQASKETKKDLAAFVAKAVRKSICKELAVVDKKRKSDDSDSKGEIHTIDAELKDFNYKDMDNLKIDSEDNFES